MARINTKRKVQPIQPITTTSPAAAPPPFALIDDALKPLAAILDTSKVYIVHIDTHPWQFKRRIFAVPVLLNLFIAALIAWRWTAAIPTYTRLFWQMLGRGDKLSSIDTSTKTWLAATLAALRRVFVLVLDYLLVSYIAPWPVTFFLERPANPVSWRWHVGFENKEVIVRVSRGWGTADLGNGSRRGAENPFFRARVLPAVEAGYLREKTGYVMMGKDFDLDFDRMVKVTQMVEAEELRLQDLTATVLAFADDCGWMVWRVRGDEGAKREEEARERIVAFKVRCFTIIRREQDVDLGLGSIDAYGQGEPVLSLARAAAVRE